MQEIPCQLRARRQQMLAIVEHEQEPPASDELLQRLADRPAGLFPDPERRGDRIGNEARIGHRREVHEPDTVGVRVQHLGGEPQRQARLADPADAGERHQPVVRKHRAQIDEVALAPDERRDLSGQVVLRDVRAGDGCGRGGLRRFEREAVTVAGYGGDGVLPQQFAQRGHLDLQVVLLDDQSGPDQVEQLVLGDQTIAPLDQRQQEVECARAERRRLLVDQELPRSRTELEAAELVGQRHGARPSVGSAPSQVSASRSAESEPSARPAANAASAGSAPTASRAGAMLACVKSRVDEVRTGCAAFFKRRGGTTQPQRLRPLLAQRRKPGAIPQQDRQRSRSRYFPSRDRHHLAQVLHGLGLGAKRDRIAGKVAQYVQVVHGRTAQDGKRFQVGRFGELEPVLQRMSFAQPATSSRRPTLVVQLPRQREALEEVLERVGRTVDVNGRVS